MLGVDRRVAQKVRRGGRRHRIDSMLAMNEPAADIDRRTHKPLDAQRVEPYCRADGVHDRIDCADFVELDFLRRNVVNLSFRDRELREDAFCDSLRIRIEAALPDHPENLRRLVMVLMVLMTVIVVMMMVVVYAVIVIAIDDDIELHRTDVGTNHTGRLDLIAFNRQLPQFRSQVIQAHTKIQQSADGHISADAGKAVKVQRLHTDENATIARQPKILPLPAW